MGERGHFLNEALQRALLNAAEPSSLDEEPLDMRDKDETSQPAAVSFPQDTALEESMAESMMEVTSKDSPVLLPSEDMSLRAKFIPLRLSFEERKSLRLVLAAINVSDYTSATDREFRVRAKRHHLQLQQIVAFLTGLVAANDYKAGQSLLEDRNFLPAEEKLQSLLEVARRYKITNPEKLRSEYGKLMYLMQDAKDPDIAPLLGVDIHVPIKTVHALLAKKNALALLADPRIAIATQEILPDKNKSRSAIQAEIRRKEKACEALSKQYRSSKLSEEEIRQCLYSICDNNSFLNSNLLPIQQCIGLLQEYFEPSKVKPEWSLSIHEGHTGARLTHSHETQYHYVLQSLHLWAAVVEDMFRLWCLAEEDMLSPSQRYELRQTGQGLQRVQQSPRVYRSMHEILAVSKSKLSSNHWIGSSVIHLGDHNVPNALLFIDKYTQVSRILSPLVRTLINIESICEENDNLDKYVQVAYGGVQYAKMEILRDFFCHAFDGSGGDNFFDAGSCIDGRLTSAWNWCSQLPSKPYYGVFKLTGFLSFDGEFDK